MVFTGSKKRGNLKKI
jgi:hypothetical protein